MAPTPTPTPSPAPSGDDFPVVVTGKVGGVRRSVPVWSGQKAVVLYLLLAQSIAQASWQADLESGTDGAGLVWSIFAGFAFFFIRDAYRQSRFRAVAAAATVAVYVVVAYYVPIARLLAAALALFFLAHVLWRGIRGT